MNIGYLHVGPQEHGLHRYGRLIAEEAKTRPNDSVIETSAALDKAWWQNLLTLHQAAQKLADADIVHFQYNKAIWGKTLSVLNLFIFALSCKAVLVVTLHDVYWEQVPFQWSKLAFYFKAMYGPKALAIRFLIHRMGKVFVCTQQEFDRLVSVSNLQIKAQEKVKIIPHFVETRDIQINPEEVRQSLDLKNKRIITLLGWIHPRKGHRLVVETLPKLPSDVMVVFAGQNSEGSGGEQFLQELTQLAETLKVADRLKITGYLSEKELEEYLMVTDVAVCPFMKCSASGSLSTWISISHPKVAAYKLPQIEGYNSISPGSIHTFEPYTASSLAMLLSNLLSQSKESNNTAIDHLRSQLQIRTIVEDHTQHYAQVIHRSNSFNSKCNSSKQSFQNL
ncbi:glycosyltransferase family 4 protein [Leptothoe sp. ISB3NOV94-8A]